LKWHLQSSFFLLHSATIHLQEVKDSNDEEDSRPISSTWSYIIYPDTIHTWTNIKKRFLEKFFPASRTTSIWKEICGIR